MLLKDKMKNGQLYREFGHENIEDQEYEKEIERQRLNCKARMFEYNHCHPDNKKEKQDILRGLLGHAGENIWIEAPAYFAYGCNTYIGENFYANFNLVVVDDIEVHIGNNVMVAPNVTLSVTGHPVDPEYRRGGTQFSLPIVIGDDVWIGANSDILPGVTIGDNSVIGAGSVVTQDIPANSVAYGVPCRVIREINDYDKEYYRKGKKVNLDW